MFAWIIRSSLTFRFLIVAAAAALIAFGADELRRMPVDVFPEFAPAKVEVQTEGLGMTSTEVEELVTIPIEDALRGTPGVDVIRSSSVVGLSQVVLLLPTLCEREVVVTWNTPPGTSHAETQRITARASRELQTVPGVAAVAAHVGRAVTGDQVVGMNASQIWVRLDERAQDAETLAKLREVIEGYPGVERGMHTYLDDKLNDVLTGENRPIVVRVYGPRPEVRRQQAEAVRQALAGIDGLVDLHVEGEVEEPQVQVKVNLDAAGRADVKPGDVRRASATVFSGIVVGYLFKEQKIFEVVVWGTPESRQSLANLRDLWIDKADRTRVRLRDVADVSVASAPTVIRHERIAPYVDVVANVAGRDLRSVSSDVDARVRTMRFPLEHRAELLGEVVEREKARQRTLGVIAASLAGIFLLLQACFGSWRIAIAASIGVAGAIAGGMLAALVTGGGNVLGALLGSLAVLAISARHVILLYDGYLRPDGEGAAAADVDAVVRVTGMRVQGILASAAGVAAMLLPVLVMGNVAGLEIARSIAVVVLGGVIASALITLFVLPAFCLRARRGMAPIEDLRLREA
jgi:Cu/Ag efflux pump CusA